MGTPEFWFAVVTALFVGYFVLEGFDFGVGMLMPVLGRSGRDDAETRRRVVLNTIGPVWDGNEVWLITAGGVLFAAFPEWYATLFSGFYLPLLLILVALILRICAIEYRGKIDDPVWRRRCDLGIGIGSWVPAVLWGVAFANIVRGVAIDADKKVTSGLLDLLTPYALLGGATTAMLFAFHGAVFIALKTAGEVRADASRLAAALIVPTVVGAGVFALWTQLAHGKGWTWWIVAAAVAGLVTAAVAVLRGRDGWAFVGTTVTIGGAVLLLFCSLFPDVMPSTIDAAFSLTVDNASSSAYTLRIMAWLSAIVAPVVLAYQGWTYWVFRRRISTTQIPASIGLASTR
ncbi:MULTISPECIES: cytochrome d ubiquinol oxidase subunit II [unclassified Rhodococcus (in: high G+C Gram-positive bacteria)]|uniref:cytochrome d ubiquinol oxidase subunit II n=1 Tax=unclassified Rhodococcus (in: high G+C Gram-positive bacteria) TaxID=192944 RepID=UPI0006FF98D1|nr:MULTISPECIES: cytochrome d ubiquinol oxidase subunit II [unclassified Rhodococcus (in: high G+C Gram-positive bacteria)]KQU39630.1 cytochrome C oxidase assembly protein [Rhodococcus sp. Leaf225]KQU44067.1 cytochrome C oxidase assembly protein [Rhodococcus sp. Leaf258]